MKYKISVKPKYKIGGTRNNEKRIIALLTAVSVAFSPAASVLANAEIIPSEEKQYVIVTEDKEVYDEISEEVMENIAADSSVLEENQIIVAELTESEAAALDAEKNVLVEEDIILSGSTGDSFTEEDDTEEEELTAEEAKRRKEEMKRKKRYDVGLLMVAAAGNDGEAVEYPAAFPEVMAVAAKNPEADISEFSNTGEELDVAAPGEKVRVAAFFDGNQVMHGTSIAAPHVTGAASLLWEKDLTKSNEFIRHLINESAKAIEGTDECGLLDVGYAEQMYDAFAETYQEEGDVTGIEIPENTVEAESFEEVNTDEAYVEGRWGGSDHQAAVTTESSGKGFSTTAINIIKQGAVYPDQNANWSKGKLHPWWHGRWQTHSTTSWKDINNRNEQDSLKKSKVFFIWMCNTQYNRCVCTFHH